MESKVPAASWPAAEPATRRPTPLDPAEWRDSLQARFDRAWAPFLVEMKRQLEGGYLTSEHAQRARFLLTHKIVARPLLPSNAVAVADFIAERGYQGNLLVRHAGMTLEEERAVRRVSVPEWAATGNPLSITLWIDDQLHATFLCHDVAADGSCDRSATDPDSPTRPAWTPRVRSVLGAIELANAHLNVALAAQRTREGSVGSTETWIEVVGAASSDVFRVHLAAPDTPAGFARSWMQVVQPLLLNGIAECGVYTHIRVIAHDRSINDQPGPIAKAWRRKTGAPLRTADWDIHLTFPYVDLGLPGNSGHSLHIVAVQIRPFPTRVWRRPVRAASRASL